MKKLQTVCLRQNAVYIPQEMLSANTEAMTKTTAVFVAKSAKLGFGFSEELLEAIKGLTPRYQSEILSSFKKVTGVTKNWTPLVKGWDTPTQEGVFDHLVTFFANALGMKKGTTLSCGHLIPNGTFPLERYNGCPFCGTPFQFGKIEYKGQGSKLKVLDLWTDENLEAFFKDLLKSKTALDATQIDNLKILLRYYEVPEIEIAMKETKLAVIDHLIEMDMGEKAKVYFSSPTDILRYLWYKHTGFQQLIQPKVILKKVEQNNRHIARVLSTPTLARLKKEKDLRLKYSRKECRMVASWLNALELSPEKACEMMHPKREIWVRFIRALRLSEFSKKKGFEKLGDLLDVFYNQTYSVWGGELQSARLKSDAERAFQLLKQRPGVFARSLFSNMLWFGAKPTATAFSEVIDQVPARLVFTLNSYADDYFDPEAYRLAKPLGGTPKQIGKPAMLELYNVENLAEMKTAVEGLCISAMEARFSKIKTESKTIYIDPSLFKMPVSIGERGENIQDLPVALAGTKFPVQGSKVRLFMQWGEGLPAQHLDMDLSCSIAYTDKKDTCSYSKLNTVGCKHSGDIRSIPSMIGTAEYIDIDLDVLEKKGALFVSFTCNAYSNGSITPNLVLGWMDSKFPMRISKKTGVAYDPSCVQHQVRISQQLTKGLVFGVLDVKAREITWLEMPFFGQRVQNLTLGNVKTLLKKLDSRLNIGALLQLKAEAQSLELVDSIEADEVYDTKWARNAAAVTQLLVD